MNNGQKAKGGEHRIMQDEVIGTRGKEKEGQICKFEDTSTSHFVSSAPPKVISLFSSPTFVKGHIEGT